MRDQRIANIDERYYPIGSIYVNGSKRLGFAFGMWSIVARDGYGRYVYERKS